MFNKQNLFAKPGGSTSPERRPNYPNNLGNRGSSVLSGATASSPSNSLSSDNQDANDSTEKENMTDNATATPEAESSGSQLIVGPDVKLKGAEILDCDTLVVEGRVEATMDSRVIKIAEKGSFSGKVCIDVAEVHGDFDGELTARKQLVIHATGKVSGVIRYGKILIEEGGIVSGDVQSMNAEEAAKTARVQPLVANKA
ncbi:MAG: polymer-forming cytoskeletal protein [Rhodocyclaceae bacterium]|nr:polymer-forming cytoskeletal protein [Rhodocyclaceae bacterium]